MPGPLEGLVFTTIRRLATVVAASALLSMVGVAAAHAHELYTGFSGGTIVVQLSNQQTYDAGLSDGDAMYVCSSGEGGGVLWWIDDYRSIDLTACYTMLHDCAKDIPQVFGYLVAERAAVTMYTDSDGVSRFHCWTFPNDFQARTLWNEPTPPPTLAAQESDPRFVVFDHTTPSMYPRLASTIGIARVASREECQTAECGTGLFGKTLRVSGNWFVEEHGGNEFQTQALTYVDWNGEYQTSWLRKTSTGEYLFVTFRRPWDAVEDRFLAPEYCLKAKVCSLTSSIHYVGLDEHHYTAELEEPSPSTGRPAYSAAATAGSPAVFDADSFRPGNSRGPLTYRWRFSRDLWPSLTAPVYGHSASYTWSRAGTRHVELTVSDAVGHTAVTTLTVVVGAMPGGV